MYRTSLLYHSQGNIDFHECRLFNLWTFIFLIGITFNVFYVGFSLGLNYDIYDEYYLIDIVAILIMLGDSLLRPFLAVDK